MPVSKGYNGSAVLFLQIDTFKSCSEVPSDSPSGDKCDSSVSDDAGPSKVTGVDAQMGGRIGDEDTGGEFTQVCEGELSP